MSLRRNCRHGVLVNETCVCDLLWRGDECQLRDCQAGQLRNGICECPLRHAGEFCEYHACYHKDVLYCWGLKDVQFLPCNTSAIGGHVDPNTVKDAAWYCPCGEGRRTPPPYSHCVCAEGYGGDFCSNRICSGGRACSDTPTSGLPFFNDNQNGPGIVVPDSVKVAMVCMSMVVLVALIVWLKRLCIRKQSIRESPEFDPESATRYQSQPPLTPAELSASLLIMQARRNFPCTWETPPLGQQRRNIGHTAHTNTTLPSYEEANAAPPPYSSVMALKKLSSTTSTKSAAATAAEAQRSQSVSGHRTADSHESMTAMTLRHQDSTDESPTTAKGSGRRTSL